MGKKLRLFTCIDHDCHWPTGVASIVLAETPSYARELLDEQLREHGLKDYSAEPYTLLEVDTNGPKAIVLRDGNY